MAEVTSIIIDRDGKSGENDLHNDALFRLFDNADSSKQALLQLDGITTANTLTYRLPGATGNQGLLGLPSTVTGANLSLSTDPGADRIFFWDFSATKPEYLIVGMGLSITDKTIAVSAGGIDHGGLAGLGDDDHPHYVLNDGDTTDIINGGFSLTTDDFIRIAANNKAFRAGTTAGDADFYSDGSAAIVASTGNIDLDATLIVRAHPIQGIFEVESNRDAADVSGILRNTAAGGSTNDTCSLIGQMTSSGYTAGKIVFQRFGPYTTPSARTSHLDFYTASEGVDIFALRIDGNQHVLIPADDKYLKIGVTDTDIQIGSDGTNGIIDVATSLRIGNRTTNYSKFEADGTLEFNGTATVFNDLQFPISNAKVPAANAPTWQTFTTNTNEYGFGVNDFIDSQANETQHGWKHDSVGHVHLHITTKAANSTGSDRFAKFQVWAAYADTGETWNETSFTAELTIPDGTAALEQFYLNMGDLDLTGFVEESEVRLRIKRIAATGGTEYSGEIFITQAGIHLEHDMVGSRQELTK